MMSDALREALERTRSGYEDERVWHTFLMDAYTGGGGFQGSVRQPCLLYTSPSPRDA